MHVDIEVTALAAQRGCIVTGGGSGFESFLVRENKRNKRKRRLQKMKS